MMKTSQHGDLTTTTGDATDRAWRCAAITAKRHFSRVGRRDGQVEVFAPLSKSEAGHHIQRGCRLKMTKVSGLIRSTLDFHLMDESNTATRWRYDFVFLRH
ncbi:hypothetical protein O9992_26175 [Vibrio lentus]|nr:hypothetical protein [Vibrio lentus]